MAGSYNIYCKGIRCLLRQGCKRYLQGLHNADNESSENVWIDSCDEEHRDFFVPRGKDRQIGGESR